MHSSCSLLSYEAFFISIMFRPQLVCPHGTEMSYKLHSDFSRRGVTSHDARRAHYDNRETILVVQMKYVCEQLGFAKVKGSRCA